MIGGMTTKHENSAAVGPWPGTPSRERPSDDMIDERIDAWHRGAVALNASIYDALGWSRDEYLVWLANPRASAAPKRPLPPLPSEDATETA